jgi:hypothetical protein
VKDIRAITWLATRPGGFQVPSGFGPAGAAACRSTVVVRANLSESTINIEGVEMTMVSRYGALWIRGLWVYLMLIVINVVVGLVGAGIARLLRFAISEPLILRSVSSRLPRLRRLSQSS